MTDWQRDGYQMNARGAERKDREEDTASGDLGPKTLRSDQRFRRWVGEAACDQAWGTGRPAVAVVAAADFGSRPSAAVVHWSYSQGAYRGAWSPVAR